MNKDEIITAGIRSSGSTDVGDGQLLQFRAFVRRILMCTSRPVVRGAFLAEASDLMMDHFQCDAIELRVREGTHSCTRSIASRSPRMSFSCATIHGVDDEVLEMVGGRAEKLFGSADAQQDYHCAVAIPLEHGPQRVGLLRLMRRVPGHFSDSVVEFAEVTADILGMSLVHQQAQADLGERVKELGCLYEISRIAGEPGISLEALLKRSALLIPPGWQFPDITEARIVLDGQSYATCRFMGDWQHQTAPIVVNGKVRGSVDVAYTRTRRLLDEGPFLTEERHLIGAIAVHIGHMIEAREAEEQGEALQRQLRHADRLATIGQLAAGVAHELNEPLGGILGFAQLALKCPGLPDQVVRDVDRIVVAALHARQIITKLLTFARQVPAQDSVLELNEVVEEALCFFEARCANDGITVTRNLAAAMPSVAGDPGQVRQVVTNLAVNAVQAMPAGGCLTVSTVQREDSAVLVLEDTGEGMSPQDLDHIFLPFLTTKDVDHGTGLGLAVVHGIVAAHGGEINVSSVRGEGSRFEIIFPLRQA